MKLSVLIGYAKDGLIGKLFFVIFDLMKHIIFAIAILVSILSCNSKGGQPAYSILSAVKVYTGKGIAGEVLIPSLSRSLQKEEREQVLREIMKAKGWHIISAYTSVDAYKEKNCAPYEKRSKAYKEGYIGKVDELGQFSE